VTLDGEFRFTPAAPFYLAGGLLPDVGATIMGFLLILETGTRRSQNFLAAMEGQSPIAAALAVMGLVQKLLPSIWYLPAILGPAVFVLVTLVIENATRSRLSPKERIHWLRARMQIRPFAVDVGDLQPGGGRAEPPESSVLLAPGPGATGYRYRRGERCAKSSHRQHGPDAARPGRCPRTAPRSGGQATRGTDGEAADGGILGPPGPAPRPAGDFSSSGWPPCISWSLPMTSSSSFLLIPKRERLPSRSITASTKSIRTDCRVWPLPRCARIWWTFVG
jgi:hypothetical protein